MCKSICPICGLKGVNKKEEFSYFLIFQQIKCVKLKHSYCSECGSDFGDEEDLSLNVDNMKIVKKGAEEHFKTLFGKPNVLDAQPFEYANFSWNAKKTD